MYVYLTVALEILYFRNTIFSFTCLCIVLPSTIAPFWFIFSIPPPPPIHISTYGLSITANTCNVGVGEDGHDANKVGKNKTEVVIQVKRLSNFWRALNIPLINFKVELVLTWSKNCVLADMTAANNPPTGLEFEMKDTKLYVPFVTLSKKTLHKTFRTIKNRFKRTIKWNKHRSQMTAQPQNNNLNNFCRPNIYKC